MCLQSINSTNLFTVKELDVVGHVIYASKGCWNKNLTVDRISCLPVITSLTLAASLAF